ncbi:MAG: DUF6443 domain-containing protein, partial [Ginsengibacter sp.]
MLNLKIACILLAGCCITVIAHGQVIPNSQTLPANPETSVRTIPASYSADGSKLNYVRVYDAEMPFGSDTSLSSTSRAVQEVKQTTQYFDGFGRTIQTVTKGISPNGYDLVVPELYDSFGREQFQYLPYISTTKDGNFKNAAFTEQSTFRTGFDNGEKFFYEQSVFEPSPLNRVTGSYAAGNSWIGSGKGTAMQYLTNTVADSVVIWNIGYTDGNTPTKGTTVYYPAGTLYKNVVTDEQGHEVVEYKNKEGQVILKKVQIAATVPATAYTGWLCTYYIYDNLFNLRFVIQPSGVAALLARSWVFDGTTWAASPISKGLCFSYEYDGLRRMTKKRVPGAGETWMVYDARDRLVMTQDSLQRLQGKWLYTDYDSLNRPVVTGIWTTSGDINYHQNLASSSTTYPTPSSNYTVLTQTWYDDYSQVNTNGSGLATSFITTNTTNTNYFYSASDVTFPYPRAITSSAMTRGMVTGTKVNVIGTSNYLYAVNYYDDRARLIETQSTNYTGGKDTVVMQYGFNGKLLRTLAAHGKGGSNPLAFSTLTKTFYDAADRVTAITKKVGNSFEDSIVVNKYDELGRLSLKKIGQKRTGLTNLTYTANPIDTLRYTYNIRGWLRGINKDYANAVNGASNWFGMELNYDYGFTQSQLNGNIAGMKWRNNADGAQRAYGFNYDAANRLTKGDFTQYTSGAWNTTSKIDFSVHSISYDLNGNILAMNQMGVKLNSPVLTDSLIYGYNTNSNQLNYVTDKVNDTTAHLGDFTEINNNTAQDYYYDGNGNMNQDNNKAISNIHYNYLNLPDSITITGKGYIKYIYDAAGNKEQKITIDNPANKKTVTTYTSEMVYQYTAIPSTGTGLDTLQFIGQEEGRIRPKTVNKSDTMLYDFFERDHLGNVRVVLTDEQHQDVYPAATVENNTNAFATEKNYYTINTADTMSTSRIASWNITTGRGYANNNGNPPYNNNPYANTTATSAIVYRLNGSTGDKTGLGITLKVMSGDIIDIFGKSFWHSSGVNPNNNYLITSALNSFISSFAGTSTVTAVHGATALALENSTVTTS